MKKGILGILTALLALSMIFTITGCPTDGGDDDGPAKITITFDQNYAGAPTATTKQIEKGKAVGALPTPSRAGHTLDGWFPNSNGSGIQVAATTTFSASTRIYAKWTENPGVTSVTVSGPPQVEVGSSDAQYNTFAAIVVTTGGVAQTVTWEVTGGKTGTSINTNTGVLTVASDEVVDTELTITATSTYDITKSDSTTTTVVAAGTAHRVTSVTITSTVTTANVDNDVTLTAEIDGQNLTVGTEDTISWTIVPTTGATVTPTTGTSVTFKATVAGTYTVTATSDFDGSKSDSVTIVVSGGGGPEPEFVEKLFLENGAYAIYMFEIPTDSSWESYKEITVDYMIDAENLAKSVRNNRLMGPYYEADFNVDANPKGPGNPRIDHNGALSIDLNQFWSNNRHIMDSKSTGFANMGITEADTWTTVTYDISGSSAYPDFGTQGTNPAALVGVPAATYNGKIYFGIGFNGGYGSKGNAADGITQLVRRVTLVGYTGTPDVVSTGSGFDKPTFIANVDPVLYSWRGAETASVAIPQNPPGCACVNKEEEDCKCGAWDCNCDLPKTMATANYTVDLANAIIYGKDESDADIAEITATPGVKNTTSWVTESNSGNKGPFFIRLDFPMQGDKQLDIRSYEKYTVKAKFYDASGVELTGTPKPNGYFRFRLASVEEDVDPDLVPGVQVGGGQWNINYDTVRKLITATGGADKSKVRWIAVQNGGTNAENGTVEPAFVEITEITFHAVGDIEVGPNDYDVPLGTAQEPYLINATARSGNWGLAFTIPFPAGQDIDDYAGYTILAQYLDENKNPVAAANGTAQIVYTTDIDPDKWNNKGVKFEGTDKYNLGTAEASEKIAFPESVKAGEFTYENDEGDDVTVTALFAGWGIQWANQNPNAVYVKVTRLILLEKVQ